MSMNQFSLTRFSIPSSDSSGGLNLRLRLYESLNGAISLGAKAEIKNMLLSETSSCSVQAQSGIPFSMDLKENMQGSVEEYHAIGIKGDFSEAFLLAAELGATILCAISMKEEISSDAQVGARIGSVCHLSEKMLSESEVGALLSPKFVFTEIFGVAADVSTLEEKETLIQVSIPPGSELRVDLENYTVTLDGENILHLQEGDWFRLSRELQLISIDTGIRGTLKGEMIYRERWL